MSVKLRLTIMSFLEFAVWGAYLTSMGNYLGSVGLGPKIGLFYAMQGIVSIFMPAIMGIVANPSGQITSQFFAVIVCGIILAIPYIIYELWRFVKPALKESERKYAAFTIFAVTFFFVLGVLFSYYMLLPLCTQFLFTYDPFGVGNTWTLPSYIDLFVQLLLSMGVMFLMPVFVYFLTSIGILTPKFLKEYRKHAFIVVLVIAAAITPNDVYSMVLVTIPLWLLYELSVLVSNSVYQKQLKSKKELVKN